MDRELLALETKLALLVSAYQQLQSENATLQLQLNIQTELVDTLKNDTLLVKKRLTSLVQSLP